MVFGFFDLLRLIGALGFFIYGMKVMSDGIQKVAGGKMREILEAMTSNRFKGVLTGFLITSLIQSSSATTVMVVSFVNAGLLNLIEAIGVIMGANIGTTITAWLISIFGFKFKIATIALPIIAIGFPMLFFSSNRWKSTGEVFIGFALLFMGLDELKNAVPDLRENPEMLEFLSAFTGKGILSTLFFVVVGTLLTIVVQSSSAAMALTLTLVFKGVIPYDVAAAIVLGENIGTTITANLAALVANVHAKRAARAHFIFNVFGVTWMVVAFPWFLKLIDVMWMPVQDLVLSLNPGAELNEQELKLSLFHSMFNIVNVLILFWFATIIAKVVTKMVPSKGDDLEFHLEFIGRGLVQTPEISLEQVEKEMLKFAKLNRDGIRAVNELINETERRAQNQLLEKIKQYEEITDRLELEIGKFLAQLSKLELSEGASEKVQSFLSAVNHLEEVGDVFYRMSLAVERKIEKKIWFDQSQRNELTAMFELVMKMNELVIRNIEVPKDKVEIAAANKMEKELNEMRDKLRSRNFKKIEKGKLKLETALIHNDLISGYEKIGDNLFHTTESLAGVNLE